MLRFVDFQLTFPSQKNYNLAITIRGLIVRKLDANDDGMFHCEECGAVLNIPEKIPQVPVPSELESERIENTMANIRCPNTVCNKSYIYDISQNIIRVPER